MGIEKPERPFVTGTPGPEGEFQDKRSLEGIVSEAKKKRAKQDFKKSLSQDYERHTPKQIEDALRESKRRLGEDKE